MAQFASDSFTDTDGTTLQAHDASWVEQATGGGGDLLITSNRVQQRASGGGWYYHSTSPSSANYSVSADFYVVSVSPDFNYTGIIGRGDPSTLTYYQARYGTAVGWQLVKAVAGTGTVLGTVGLPMPVAGNTYVVKIDMSGSTIRLLVDGVELVSVTDTSISAAGKSGLRVFNNNIPTSTQGLHFDNFSADQVGGGGVTYTITPSGLVTLLGSTSLLKTKVFLPSGNLSFSGSSNVVKTKLIVPSGEVTLSGQAGVVKGRVYSPSGGLSLSGSTIPIKSKIIAPTGSIAFAGTASLSGAVSYQITPVGKVNLMGSTKVIKSKVLLPTGRVNFSGSAPMTSNTVTQVISSRIPMTGAGL